jgi:hypothetical protein
MFYTHGSSFEIGIILHSSKYSYAKVPETDSKHFVKSVLHFSPPCLPLTSALTTIKRTEATSNLKYLVWWNQPRVPSRVRSSSSNRTLSRSPSHSSSSYLNLFSCCTSAPAVGFILHPKTITDNFQVRYIELNQQQWIVKKYKYLNQQVRAAESRKFHFHTQHICLSQLHTSFALSHN